MQQHEAAAARLAEEGQTLRVATEVRHVLSQETERGLDICEGKVAGGLAGQGLLLERHESEGAYAVVDRADDGVLVGRHDARIVRLCFTEVVGASWDEEQNRQVGAGSDACGTPDVEHVARVLAAIRGHIGQRLKARWAEVSRIKGVLVEAL